MNQAGVDQSNLFVNVNYVFYSIIIILDVV